MILEHGENIKYLPYVFTEQGVAMLSSVLRSPRAVEVNIAIMRTFVQLRRSRPRHPHVQQTQLVDRRGDQAERAARYRSLACQKGYRPACGTAGLAIAPAVVKP